MCSRADEPILQELLVQRWNFADHTRENQGVGVACTKGLKPEAPNQDSFVTIFQTRIAAGRLLGFGKASASSGGRIAFAGGI